MWRLPCWRVSLLRPASLASIPSPLEKSHRAAAGQRAIGSKAIFLGSEETRRKDGRHEMPRLEFVRRARGKGVASMKKSTMETRGLPMGSSAWLAACVVPTADDDVQPGKTESRLILSVHNGVDDVWTPRTGSI
jgi:hypothetical protein